VSTIMIMEARMQSVERVEMALDMALTEAAGPK
jgi:hypothetical protein